MPTFEPGYNDIGLCVTSSISSDIPWYNNSSLLTVTLLFSVRSTLLTTENVQPLSCRYNRVRLYFSPSLF